MMKRLIILPLIISLILSAAGCGFQLPPKKNDAASVTQDGAQVINDGTGSASTTATAAPAETPAASATTTAPATPTSTTAAPATPPVTAPPATAPASPASTTAASPAAPNTRPTTDRSTTSRSTTDRSAASRSAAARPEQSSAGYTGILKWLFGGVGDTDSAARGSPDSTTTTAPVKNYQAYGGGQIMSLTPAYAPLSADFIEYGTPFTFNEYDAAASGNIDGAAYAKALRVPAEKNFSWSAYNGGRSSCLMILVDAADDGAINAWLNLPKYGVPVVSRIRYNIYIEWTNPGNPIDTISLMFEDESSLLVVHSNTTKGINPRSDSDVVEMAVEVFRDDSGYDRYYVPLYAILNETGGGVLYDPFGSGYAFIFMGDIIQGYTGMWETSDRGEYRTDVVVDGVTHSISSYWTGLELFNDGTFLESNRFWQDSNQWVLLENKGRWVFFGRILFLMYETESMYRGEDYTALSPQYVDSFGERWAVLIDGSPDIRYVIDWDEKYLNCAAFRPLYGGLAESGEAAPRPRKADNTAPDQSSDDNVFNGFLQRGAFFHDGRNEWIEYYYVDVGEAQLNIMKDFLDDAYYDFGDEIETEIQVYSVDESVRLDIHAGYMIAFKGEFFAAHTIYHRRNIVFMITELL